MIGTEEILNNQFDILMLREILPQYTDYSLVNRWWHFGHEIASHSITHRNDLNYWKVKIVMMIDEVNGDDDEVGVEIWHSPTLL